MEKSNCCNANVKVMGDTTHYYLCESCNEPCNISGIEIKNNKIITIKQERAKINIGEKTIEGELQILIDENDFNEFVINQNKILSTNTEYIVVEKEVFEKRDSVEEFKKEAMKKLNHLLHKDFTANDEFRTWFHYNEIERIINNKETFDEFFQSFRKAK